MTREIPEIEEGAEQMLKAFPNQPVVCADVHSIAISLKRIADAFEKSKKKEFWY